MGLFISQSVQTVLYKLSLPPRKSAGERIVFFPSDSQNAVREHIHEGESLHEWLKRMVEIVGNEDSLLLEDNIAFLGEVKSLNGELQYVNLQALVTVNGSIKDFIRGTIGIDVQYFRLDFDYTKLGKGIFNEPLPHLHTLPKDEPRFSLFLTSAQTSIIDFLEFLYMNYQYDIWREWARNEWAKRSLDEDAYSLFNIIDEAYKKGQIDFLKKEYNTRINEIKKCLHNIKVEFSNLLPTIPDIANLLDYKSPTMS